MGQVWSKADFDGNPIAGFHGGHGSVLAATAQNPGIDGVYGTSDDVLAPLNERPVHVSMDASVGSSCNDPLDRVRNFTSMHAGGANFLLGDGSVRFVNENIDQDTYRGLSTISGDEPIGEF